jgi:hypothetical protein
MASTHKKDCSHPPFPNEASSIQRLSALYPISIYLENHQFYLIDWQQALKIRGDPREELSKLAVSFAFFQDPKSSNTVLK